MSEDTNRQPVHANPPIEGAIPTAHGWRHPVTDELLVSVRGLVDDNGSTPATPAKVDTVPPSAEVVVPAEPVVVTEPAVPAEPVVVTEPAEPAEPVAFDNSLFKFEKSGKDGIVQVTLRAPNHHAYTKWVVDGAEIEGVRGNVTEFEIGTAFTANNAKGTFNGQAVEAE